jgi:hypothetical protein
MDKDRSIKVYPGAAPTEPCPYGPPLPDLPTNFLLAAPTASGKTQIILNLILKYYRGQFARIWLFCPSSKLDPQFKPLIAYLEKMTDQKREPLIFEEFDPVKVGQILDEQRQIVESCRKRGVKPPQVCMILDDLADHGDIFTSRRGGQSGGSWLVTLGVRSRHLCVTWIVSTQKLNLIGTVLRANTRTLCVWRLRSQKEVDLLCEELSGYYPKDVILDIFEYATREPYSWLTVKLDAKEKKDIFWLRFERRLLPESLESTNEQRDGPGPVGVGPAEPVEEQRPGPSEVRGKGGPVPARGKGGKAG